MFCEKCDTQVEDNALSCHNYEEKNSNNDLQIPVKVNAKKIVLSIASMVLIGVLVVSLFGGGGYKKTLDNYYKAHEKNDADLMYSSVVTQYWIDYTNEAWSNSAFESIQDSIENEIDDWGCGSNIKITYEITNERRATREQLEDLEDNIYDWYAYYVYERDEFSITDAYVLDIDFIVKGDKGTKNFYYPDGFLIIKENGKWRIPRGHISNSFYDN
ncbi:MAG: hypothetical protein E7603_07225 [Ruminococcaceae bacterium]|nr:hypothetical protein [Oscillospiraceae bacterium]